MKINQTPFRPKLLLVALLQFIVLTTAFRNMLTQQQSVIVTKKRRQLNGLDSVLMLETFRTNFWPTFAYLPGK